MVVRVVDIGGIVDHHCLKFTFKNNFLKWKRKKTVPKYHIVGTVSKSKTKTKKYHTVGTVPKYNRKLEEADIKSIH